MCWNKGPLPPDTWNWGGVQTVDMTSGFIYANFCGDHVITEIGTRIEADKIAYWSNCLDLPPEPRQRTALSVEELRKNIVKGIDDALSRPIISRFISTESARIMRAQREFWHNDDGTNLNKLLALYNKEP